MSQSIYTKEVEILLIEDNPGDVLLTREALQDGKVNNNLHSVKDGVEALAFLMRQPPFADAPRPEPHKQPTGAPVRHSDPVVATNHVPEPTAPETVTPPAAIERPEPPHSTMVANLPEPSVPRSNGLLADVQGHVTTMSRQRAYNDSFRINRSAGDAHVASYETPTDIGNHGESVSGTQPITH